MFDMGSERAYFEAYRSKYARWTRIFLWSAFFGSLVLCFIFRDTRFALLLALIVTWPIVLCGSVCLAKSMGYGVTRGFPGVLSWLGVIILVSLKERIRDPKSVSLARLAEDIRVESNSKRDLVRNYRLMEQTFIRLCDHLLSQNRISEADYQRVPGRSHH